MADIAVETPAVEKRKGAKGGKAAGKAVEKPKTKKPSRPPTSEMVTKAIGEMKVRGGTSLQAIKKYIVTNYKVDADKMAPFIKKYLIGAVESGALVRTKGKGAAGSFKLEGKPNPAPVKAKTKGRRKVKKAVAVKKVAEPKKAPVVKKPAKPKTPTKAKKTAKPPTKPKTPKPKTKGVSARSKTIRKAKK